MGKLNESGLKGLIERPDRYPDGQGLFFKTLGLGRAYWTYRYRVGGTERETSLGPYPETTLEQARIKHAELRALVLKKIDPVGLKRDAKAKTADKADVPTFGQCVSQYLALHEVGWKNPKHRQQWAMTLGQYAAPLHAKPVDQITTADVLSVLEPIWTATPETASRLRGRIEMVLNAARARGHIDADRANPARWKDHLKNILPSPKKIGKRDRKTGKQVERGNHAAMPYAQLPAFWTRLSKTPGVAARALQFTILTCARTSETLGMTRDEVSFPSAVWVIPGARMKMGEPHDVPLSDAALQLLAGQMAGRGKSPFVFPGGRPRQPLSTMAMAMLMRRMGAGAFTVHGFRSAARSWMADTGVQFELAEASLAHTVGNAVVQSYQRSSMLERRRPLMAEWAKFVTTDPDVKVVSIKRRGHARAPLRLV